MVKFKDGELITPAKVNDDGTITPAVYSGETPFSAYMLNKMQEELLLAIYPVGSIYMSVNSTNPSQLFGGTWEQWGIGRVPVGVDVNDIDFNEPEKTGGEKTHKLTIDEIPSHGHEIYLDGNSGGYDYSVSAGTLTESGWSSSKPIKPIGGDEPHNNLQPYITCYMWKRVA